MALLSLSLLLIGMGTTDNRFIFLTLISLNLHGVETVNLSLENFETRNLYKHTFRCK